MGTPAPIMPPPPECVSPSSEVNKFVTEHLLPLRPAVGKVYRSPSGFAMVFSPLTLPFTF